MNMTIFFTRKRFYVIVAVLVIGLILGGCAGSSKKKAQPPKEPVAEQKGSLSRTFTIVDEQGRNAGTLALDFSGGAVLRDENGKVIAMLAAQQPAFKGGFRYGKQKCGVLYI